MTSRTENAQKRKQTAEKPEVIVSSSDDDQSKRKARRVSTNDSASKAVSLQVDTPVAIEKATVAIATSTVTEDEESIQISIGKMIQDLFHSDNAKVNAAIDALSLNLDKDKKNATRFKRWEAALPLFSY
jgi:hypothetical protein